MPSDTVLPIECVLPIPWEYPWLHPSVSPRERLVEFEREWLLERELDRLLESDMLSVMPRDKESLIDCDALRDKL